MKKERVGDEHLFADKEKLLARFHLVAPLRKSVLAVRKGAAIAAGTAGIPLQILSQTMQHATMARTAEYLGRGLADTHRAGQEVQVATSIGLQELWKNICEQ